MIMIIIIIIITIIMSPGHDFKLHPVVEFRRGIMRLPFATTTSRSPLEQGVVPVSSPRGLEIPGGRPAGASLSHGWEGLFSLGWQPS